jgi:hypothetical protein
MSSGVGGKFSGRLARIRRFTPPIVLAALGAALAAGGFLFAVGFGPAPVAYHRPVAAATATTVPAGNRSVQGVATNLPAATAAPAPATAAVLTAPPLAGREDFAFAPYWTLPASETFSLTGLSTLAYFSLGVNSNGTIQESGPGWNGFQSQDLVDLITRAHAAGERVVLAVDDFDQDSLDALTSSPSAPATLAAALIPLLQSKSFDGVNFDFEGEGSGDQAGLTTLISTVSSTLRTADPHWQITMDTYASSAGDPGGFYNIPALAPSVDAFFVMAYELNLGGTQNAVSSLTSGMFSDATTLAQYTSVVPASKVILGTPFFGIDWPTNNGTLEAKATGGASDIADAQVAPADPMYWDPVTDTGWTSYRVGQQWHESYFEDPYGLYMVAQLAARTGIRGVGIWALGMETDGPQMISALDGLAPAGSPGTDGPAATTTSPGPGGAVALPAPSSTTTAPHVAGSGTSSSPSSSTAPSSTTTTKPTSSKAPDATTTTTAPPVITATYKGTTEHLSAVGTNMANQLFSFGTLTGFSTTDPAYSCLNGKSFTVYEYGLSSEYVAVASLPTDCINQEFTFPG